LQRRHEAVGLDLVEDHPHLVGLLAGLLDPAGLAELDEHALGADRHERAGRAHEQVSALHGWARNLGDLGRAILEGLQDLFHGGPRIADAT
jgi:hypothetical protein